MTLDIFIRQENISLYKKRLADRNIGAGQREVIGKLLEEEEGILSLLRRSKTPRKRAQLVPMKIRLDVSAALAASRANEAAQDRTALM
jgi:hypothetical protein